MPGPESGPGPGALAATIVAGTVTSTTTHLGSVTPKSFAVAEKTSYVAILYVNVPGMGTANPLTVACFMTGGTYTVPNTDFSGGCFKAESAQDVRNCLCGKANRAKGATKDNNTRLFFEDGQNRQAQTDMGCDAT